MILVRHRVNTASDLSEIPHSQGVEIDVRSGSSGLHLSHEPFVAGELFTDWLRSYRHQLLIVNVKEDGLESQVTSLLASHSITNYFFLDQPIPTLVKRGLRGFRDSAVRFSEYESLDSVVRLKGLSSWVWVDFFHPPKQALETVQRLKQHNLKICLVSPELHGLERLEEITSMQMQLEGAFDAVDAVCTKFPEKWNITIE